MPLNVTTYNPRQTCVHALDARVKIVLMLVYSIALFVVDGWVGLGLLALAFAVGAVAARLPLVSAARQLAPIGAIMVVTLLANWFSIDHGFTWEGFSRGMFYVVRIALLVGASLLLTTTSTSTQITRALESFLAPLGRLGVPTRDIATVVSIALRFIPVTIDQFDTVRRAQIARGANFDTGSLVRRLRAWSTVLIPLFVQLYRRADVLAGALDARAYGLAKATHLNSQSFTTASGIVLVVGAAYCVLVALLF